jgi:hypothetical protein
MFTPDQIKFINETIDKWSESTLSSPGEYNLGHLIDKLKGMLFILNIPKELKDSDQINFDIYGAGNNLIDGY